MRKSRFRAKINAAYLTTNEQLLPVMLSDILEKETGGRAEALDGVGETRDKREQGASQNAFYCNDTEVVFTWINIPVLS